ncbi:MAG TPA: hypothetical protein VGF94_04585 [Kofleriaceae bacterium]|jgi:hypothetical protein
MRRALPFVLVLAACGRVGFDATGDAAFSGAPRCPPDVLLCDSFEDSDIDTSRWMIASAPDGTLSYDGWGVSNDVRSSTTPMPLDTWVCLEWQLSPGAMSMWMNDVPLAGMQDTPWTMPASTQKLAIGLQYQTNPGVEITTWIDEVIADSARIGCAK